MNKTPSLFRIVVKSNLMQNQFICITNTHANLYADFPFFLPLSHFLYHSSLHSFQFKTVSHFPLTLSPIFLLGVETTVHLANPKFLLDLVRSLWCFITSFNFDDPIIIFFYQNHKFNTHVRFTHIAWVFQYRLFFLFKHSRTLQKVTNQNCIYQKVTCPSTRNGCTDYTHYWHESLSELEFSKNYHLKEINWRSFFPGLFTSV